MKSYTIKWETEVTFEVQVYAESEEEAIKKLEEFDIEEDPQEVSGGGFCKDEIVSIEEDQ